MSKTVGVLAALAGLGVVAWYLGRKPTKPPEPPVIIPGLVNYTAKSTKLSYSNITKNTWESIQDELKLLSNLNVKTISCDVNYGIFLNNNTDAISKLDSAATWIHSAGKQFHISDSLSESWRNNPITWEQMKQHWKIRVELYASRYHPYSMTTIKEVGFYLPVISNPSVITVDEVIQLNKDLNAIVKANSPATITVFDENAAAIRDHPEIYGVIVNGVIEDPNQDVIGFNIYGSKDYKDNKTQYLTDYIANAKVGGKQVWIPETWTCTAEQLSTAPTWAVTNWGYWVSNYAVTNDIPYVFWFFTQTFGTLANPTPIYNTIKDVMSHYD